MENRKKIVVLTGAGISAESGLKTFRDSDGLWENFDIEDVASITGFNRNPQLVLDFYNARRRQLKEVFPNRAHLLLAEMEKKFEVQIITQNVDDLHERAGSTNILHLHGELKKVRSIHNDNEIIHWEDDLNLGDTNKDGIQLRPHIVWFGELVPELENASEICKTADILLIIGTSLQVYPAASLLHDVAKHCPTYLIDPNPGHIELPKENIIASNATLGMDLFIKILEENYP